MDGKSPFGWKGQVDDKCIMGGSWMTHLIMGIINGAIKIGP